MSETNIIFDDRFTVDVSFPSHLTVFSAVQSCIDTLGR
jgi:hypothetical protein